MRLANLSLRLCLTSIAALLLSARGAPAAIVRLDDAVVPRAQEIHLTIDPRETGYSGSVSVALEVVESTDHFRLHSEGHELERVVLTGTGGEVELSYHEEGGDLLSLRTGMPLAAGRYTLVIEFARTFGNNNTGLYRTQIDGLDYAFSQFQADDAREAFPCWDEPRFKIPYRMILTVPEEHLAVSNTPVERERSAEGLRTVTFQQTKPLPSYLLAVAVGPFETVEIPDLGVPGRIVTVKGQGGRTEVALSMTRPLLAALVDYFGSPYPFAKLDLIAVPDFWPGGMENAGAITFAENLLLADPASLSLRQRRRMATLIAHELAHMWFGGLVTMEWWNDLWLNESFADWMGEKIAQQVFPELDVDVARVQRVQVTFWEDAWATSEPIRKPVESVKNFVEGLDLAYFKGAMVLGMFERWLGQETLRRGVVSFLEAHAWGTATASDLWRALDLASRLPVSAALATFIDQPGFPSVTVAILDDGRLQLSQERFRPYESSSPELTWKVPVTVKYGIGEETATTTVFLDQPSVLVDLGLPEGARPSWVYPNAEALGYYRWNLSGRESLAILADRAGSVLSPRERIELLGNTASLLKAGQLGADDHLEVIASLADDPDTLVVRAVLGELDLVKKAFISAALEGAFARYVRGILRPSLERIGREPQSGESDATAQVRSEVMYTLGDLGHDASVIEYGSKLARSYIEDPTSVDPKLVQVALALAAMGGDLELFKEFRRRFEAAKSPTERSYYHSALGSFRGAELQKKALSWALEGSLDSWELLSFGYGNLSSDEGWEIMYRWLVENHPKVIEGIPPAYASTMASLAGGCSLERLAHAKTFFTQPENQVPGTEKELEKAAEQVEACVSARRREGEAVAKYLESR